MKEIQPHYLLKVQKSCTEREAASCAIGSCSIFLEVEQTVIGSFMKGRRKIIVLPSELDTQLQQDIESLKKEKHSEVEVRSLFLIHFFFG